jgi:hypothetical protein
LTANTPTLIDEFLPAYDVAERHQMRVRARIEQVYAAVRRLDLGGSGVVRMLFWFRELPAFFLRPSNWGAAVRPPRRKTQRRTSARIGRAVLDTVGRYTAVDS